MTIDATEDRAPAPFASGAVNVNEISWLTKKMAEGVGFEPTVPLQARRFSRPVP
jgi:hypothetical protein